VTPTFAVVVAAHNAELTVGSAIASVLNQTRPDFELVIVDDGSQDQTAQIVQQVGDPRVRLIQQANGGTATARNNGIEQTTAPLIGILDSDDLWLPDYLETMASVLESDKTAALAYTDAWVLDDVTGRVHRRLAAASAKPPASPPSDPHDLLRLLLRGNFVYVSTTFHRRVVERIGDFDARCFCEDYELWLRFAAAGYRIARAPRPLAIYRDRANSKSADKQVGLEGLRGTLELVLTEYSLDDDLRHIAERRIAAIDRQLSSPGARLDAAARALAKRVLRPYLLRWTPPREVAAVLDATDQGTHGAVKR